MEDLGKLGKSKEDPELSCPGITGGGLYLTVLQGSLRTRTPAPILQVKLPEVHDWSESRELHIHSVTCATTEQMRPREVKQWTQDNTAWPRKETKEEWC